MRAPIGMRIRRQRMDLGLSQTKLAQLVGISASYLNLIENNKREVGGAILLRIAAKLQLDIEDLSGAREQKALQRLQEVFSDPILQGLALRDLDARNLVAEYPDIAQAVVRLYRGYTDAGTEIDAYAHRIDSDPLLAQMLHEVLNRITGMRSSAEIISGHDDLAEADRQRFSHAITREAVELTATMNGLVSYFDRDTVRRRSSSPARELDDAIINADNHFPALEDLAQTLRQRIGPRFTEQNLMDHLHDRHDITCRRWPEGKAETGLHMAHQARMDAENRTLWLRSSAPHATRQFRICRQIAELAAPDQLRAVCDEMDLTSASAKKLAITALASYVAGAMIMPHDSFRQQVETHSYDIDLLSHSFSASFEQVAHRLVTLRRRGQEGIPFGFLRADPSGRLTKRFPLPGLSLPGAGHGCVLWPIYRTASTSGVIRQVVEFPNGARFLMIAKAVHKRLATWQEQPLIFSIMLACDIHHADRTVYARGLDLQDSLATVPVGPSCLLCVRPDCGHRQESASLASS